MTTPTGDDFGAHSFVNLVFVPSGIEKALKYVDQGKEILQRQLEFWRRYAAIEDTYAKSLHALLALPCVTWEYGGGIFSKKQCYQDTKVLQNTWESVKKSVEEIAIRQTNKAEALFQQGNKMFDLSTKSEAKIKTLMDAANLTLNNVSVTQKTMNKQKQAYFKLAALHKSLSKSLDDPTLTYEKRQKIEIQANLTKAELEQASIAYKKSVQLSVEMIQLHFTDRLPDILQQLEKIETDRIALTKVSYSRYAAICHTAIPTTREMCDRMVFHMDQIHPAQLIDDFVAPVLHAQKEPLKAPTVPRFVHHNDVDVSAHVDDALITAQFQQVANLLNTTVVKSNAAGVSSTTVTFIAPPSPSVDNMDPVMDDSDSFGYIQTQNSNSNNENNDSENYNNDNHNDNDHNDDVVAHSSPNSDYSSSTTTTANVVAESNTNMDRRHSSNQSSDEPHAREKLLNSSRQFEAPLSPFEVPPEESLDDVLPNIPEHASNELTTNTTANTTTTPSPEKEKPVPVKSKPVSIDWINDITSVPSAPRVTAPTSSSASSAGWIDNILKSGNNTSAVKPSTATPSSPAFLAFSSSVRLSSTSGNNTTTSNSNNTSSLVKEPEPKPLSNSSNNVTVATETESSSSSVSNYHTKETNYELSPAAVNALQQLHEDVRQNDYYKLFNLSPTDDFTVIDTKKREFIKRYQPELFLDGKAKHEAEQKLVVLTKVGNSVFKNEKARRLYDKVCAYRKEYDNLMKASDDLLQRAVTNLGLLRKAVKKSNFPSDLEEEVSTILQIIEKYRKISP